MEGYTAQGFRADSPVLDFPETARDPGGCKEGIGRFLSQGASLLPIVHKPSSSSISPTHNNQFRKMS